MQFDGPFGGAKAGPGKDCHFLQGEGVADHVAGQLLSTFGISGLDPDLVMDREAGVLPIAHALGEFGTEAGFMTEIIQQPVT